MPFTEITSTYELGSYYHSAVLFAIDYINNNKFLLGNHSLGLVWGGTECKKNKTVTLTMKMIQEQRVDAIIAVGCERCLETDAIAGSNNIPILSTVRVTNFIIVLYRFFLVLLCLVFFQKKTKMWYPSLALELLSMLELNNYNNNDNDLRKSLIII